jgi:2-amino-4-hydroxy-6-hydroxymethyldihydropteridine diphosphokinase
LSHTFISLGANLGDPPRAFRAAAEALRAAGFEEARWSRLYLSRGVDAAGLFHNAVLAGWWPHSPRQLLERCMQIEGQAGRVRRIRNEARSLDLDLLMVGDRVLSEAGLDLPHPRMHRRRFVLAPICDLAPELLHPTQRRTMRKLLESLPPREQPLWSVDWPDERPAPTPSPAH